jgi:hypothetical protein
MSGLESVEREDYDECQAGLTGLVLKVPVSLAAESECIMSISTSAKLAHEKRLLKRLEALNFTAKATGTGGAGKQLITRVFQEQLAKQRDYVRKLEKRSGLRP